MPRQPLTPSMSRLPGEPGITACRPRTCGRVSLSQLGYFGRWRICSADSTSNNFGESHELSGRIWQPVGCWEQAVTCRITQTQNIPRDGELSTVRFGSCCLGEKLEKQQMGMSVGHPHFNQFTRLLLRDLFELNSHIPSLRQSIQSPSTLDCDQCFWCLGPAEYSLHVFGHPVKTSPFSMGKLTINGHFQ